MTFTHDPATSEGQLRSLIDDKDASNYVFEDAELTAILDLNADDLWSAAADCCRSLAAKYAKEAFLIGLGKEDILLDRKKKAQYYLWLAKTYDERSNSDSVEFIDSFNIDSDFMGNDESEYVGDIM